MKLHFSILVINNMFWYSEKIKLIFVVKTDLQENDFVVKIDLQENEMLHHKENLNGYLSYQTDQSLYKIKQDTDREFFMTAKEAKEYGLIDGVIPNPLKALQPLSVATEVNDKTSV